MDILKKLERSVKKLASLGLIDGHMTVTKRDVAGKIYTKKYEFKSDITRFDENIKCLKSEAKKLYEKRKEYINKLITIKQDLLGIENLPSWFFEDLNEALGQIDDFRTAVEYEKSPKEYVKLTDKTGRAINSVTFDDTIKGLGTVVAMAIATVVGTVTTGTAIYALSSSAATNAALAWLGGGRAAAGGVRKSDDNGGLLDFGLFGGVVAIIAAGLATGHMLNKIKNNSQNVQDNKDAIRQGNQYMEPKLRHLAELITRSDRHFKEQLCKSIEGIKFIQPKDYKRWDDSQKLELEKLINAVSNMVQLINERI